MTGVRRLTTDAILHVLRCPLCAAELAAVDNAITCPNRHTFNIARQGYLSLLSGHLRPTSGDTSDMVQARRDFLQAGHYAPVTELLARLATSYAAPNGVVLDVGAGTGHYLAAVLDGLPGAHGLGLDTSTHALRSAARAHPRGVAASWDVFQPLPVASGAVDLVLDVFAPRNAEEFYRVLRPSGALIVVTPTERHLSDLRQALEMLTVDPDKDDRLHRKLSPHFTLEHAEVQEYVMRLDRRGAADLVGMGPTARHLGRDEVGRRLDAEAMPIAVTVSVRAAVYRPR